MGSKLTKSNAISELMSSSAASAPTATEPKPVDGCVAAGAPPKERIGAERIREGVVIVRIAKADYETVVRAVSVARGDFPRVHDVGGVVVVEASSRVARHASHDVEQVSERVVLNGRRRTAEGAEVPMVIAHVGVEAEGVGCDRGEHRARSVALERERVAIAAVSQLEALPAAHKVVIARIERKQHADPALGIGVQHDEVAVLRRLDVNAGAVAGPKLIVIEANSDGCLSEQRCKQKRQHHVSNIPRLA